jgi:hypothetical protein
MSTSIYLDPSFSSALTQYAGGSVSLEALVWQRFVVAYQIDVSQPITDAEQAQFQTYLEKYASIGLSTSALIGTATPPNTSNYLECYLKILNSPYLSWAFDASQDPTTSQGIRDIWNSFLQTYNIDSSQVDSIDFSALFSTYIGTLERKAASYIPSTSTTEADPEKDLQIALWNRFLTVYGYSPTQTSTPVVEKQFSQFLQQYELWGIDVTTLTSTNTLPSGTGSEFFLSFLNSFYGQYSTIELTDLWNRFLQSQGLTTNPDDLDSLQQPFVAFLKTLMTNKASFEATTGLSPANVAQRELFGSVMAGLSKMLAATEQVVVTNAAALKIYGEWQETLTKQMTRAPNLVPVSDSDMTSSELTTVRIPSGAPVGTDHSIAALINLQTSGVLNTDGTIPADAIVTYGLTSLDQTNYTIICQIQGAGLDPTNSTVQTQYGLVDVTSSTATTTYWNLDKFTLGYNKTTMNEVIKWAYDKLLSDPSTPVSFTAGGTYTFSFVTNTDGSKSLQVSITGPAGDTSSASIAYTNSLGQYMLADGEDTTPLVDSFENWTSAIGNTFCKAMSSLPSSVALYRGIADPLDSTKTIYVTGLTGHYTSSSVFVTDPKTGVQTLDTSAMQNRQEQNAILQQYVAQIRAKRAVVQNASSLVQSSLQTAQTSINKIASLWTSILQAIATILQTLYQHA